MSQCCFHCYLTERKGCVAIMYGGPPFLGGGNTAVFRGDSSNCQKKKKRQYLQRENERIMNKCSKPLPFGNLGKEDTGVALTVLAIC